MEKSENVELELVKSELAAEQAKSADLKKSFDKATELLTNLVKKDGSTRKSNYLLGRNRQKRRRTRN